MSANYPIVPSQVWRQQGAPESTTTVSQSFLSKLAVKLGLKRDAAPHSEDLAFRSEALVTETDDYDCRIGEKAKKRRREAQKILKVTGQTGQHDFRGFSYQVLSDDHSA